MLVTPVLRWLAGLIIQYGGAVRVGVWTVVIGAVIGAGGGWWVTREVAESVHIEIEGSEGEGEGKAGDDADS